MPEKLVAQNKQARRDYHVLETFEAGIALMGTEVKSLRNGKMTLKDSYIEERRGELYMVKAHIPPYEHGNVFNHEPERDRKLLMHKREILRLAGQVQEKGLTLIPLKVYFKDGIAKVQVALCRGKAKGDRRETIKKREAEREMDRAMKAARKK